MIFSGGSVVICVCLSGCYHHGRAAVAYKSFYLFYSFNCFHHDHNAKIRLGRRDTLEEVTRMRAKGMGHNRARLQIKCALKKKTQSSYTSREVIYQLFLHVSPSDVTCMELFGFVN